MYRHLLNFWLFPIFGMFFAAGASAIVDAGAGGASGSTDGLGSGGDAGDGSTSLGEGSGTGTGEGTGDGAAEGSGQVQGETTADPNALIDSGDGRKIPQKYAELFKTDKELRDSYFGYQALRKTYPGGVREAVQLKKDVEEIGGLEAVEQLRGQVASQGDTQKLFESGDPKWVEAGFQDNPASALKMFTHSLGYVAEKHPEHYNHLMAKVIQNDLDASLPVRDLHSLLSGLKDNPKAQELASALAKYYNEREKLARSVPEEKENPEAKKLAAEKEQLNTEKQQIRNEKINSQAVPHLNKSIDDSLNAIAQTSGFDLAKVRADQPKRYDRFMKDVKSAIHESVLQDEKWLGRYSDALAANDVNKCVRMLNARHEQALKGDGNTPGILTERFEEWFGPTKKVAAKPAPTQARPGTPNQGGAPARVSAMPHKSEIDWSHPKTRVIDQVAALKTGKIVTWAS